MRSSRRRGFSLLELIVVLVVISVLSALAVPAMRTVRDRSLDSGAKTALVGVLRSAAAQIELSDRVDGWADVLADAVGELPAASVPAVVASGWSLLVDGDGDGVSDVAPAAVGEIGWAVTGPAVELVTLSGSGSFVYAYAATPAATPELRVAAVYTLPGGGVPSAPSLAAPTSLAVTAGDSTAVVSWTPGSGSSDTQVWRASSPDLTAASVVATVAGGSWTDSAVTNGATYWWWVTARADGQSSPAAGPVSATPATPVPTANLTGWWRPEGLPAPGQSVAVWGNEAPAATADAEQSSVGSQPTVVTTELNGYRAARFSSDFLTFDAGAVVGAAATGAEVFLVSRHVGTDFAGNGSMQLSTASTTAGTASHLPYSDGTSYNRLLASGRVQDTSPALGQGTAAYARPHVLSVASGPSGWTQYFNGALDLSASARFARPNVGSFGKWDANGTYFHDADYWEVLVYDTVLDSATRTQVLSYLYDKYGLDKLIGLEGGGGPQLAAMSWLDPADPDMTGVEIRRGGVLLATVARGGEAFAEDGLVDGTTYHYELTVAYGSKPSPAPMTVSVTAGGVLPQLGLRGHYDSASLAGLADGAPVTSWADSSNRSGAAVPGMDAAPTITDANALNGHRPVVFNGSTNALEVGGGWADGTELSGELFLTHVRTGGNGSYTARAGVAGTGSHMVWSGTTYDAALSTGRMAFSGGGYTAPTIYNVVSKAGLWQARTNGTVVHSTTSNGFSPPTLVRFGKNLANGTYWHQARYYNFLYYERNLTQIERDAVEAYLGGRYGIPVA